MKPAAWQGWAAALCVATGAGYGVARAQPPLELNCASRAQLEQVKGIGVALAERLLQAREKSPFADWNDVKARVPGVGRRSVDQLAAQGVTVTPAACAPSGRPASAATDHLKS